MTNAPETVALRRIALLVMRASEDCGPIRDDLAKIAIVIDQMKRSIVLDVPMDKDAARLSLLVRQLSRHPGHANANCHRLCNALVNELQELVPLLRRSCVPAA